MKNKIFLSVIVPTYNADKFIYKNINKLLNKLKKIEKKYEIIIINDGSTDNTKKILNIFKLKKVNIKIFNFSKNQGKGAAVKKGIKVSNGENIIFIDCDLPYFNSLEKLYYYLKIKNYNLVISTREKKPFKDFYRNKNFLLRKFFASFLNKLIRTFIVKGFTDTQAGLKGFKKKVKNKICLFNTNGFLFDVEILRAAKKNNLIIKKIPVKDKIQDYTLNHVTNIKFYFSILYDLIFILKLILYKKI